jgi:hypothetical protein
MKKMFKKKGVDGAIESLDQEHIENVETKMEMLG